MILSNRRRHGRVLLAILLLLVVFNESTVYGNDDPSSKNDPSRRPHRRSTQKWLTKLRHQLQNSLRRLPIFKNNHANDEPEPRVVDHFLTANEAALLLQRYEPLLRESRHFGGRGVVDSQYRTSHSVRLPPLGDELVFDIEQRAARLAGMDHGQVEDFQLACYGVDELYGLHRDDDSDPVKRADRSATVLIYLQAPISGGATLFTRRAIEDERDLDTKQRLTTEKGALKLFRKYCARPSKKFVVIETAVGRAATWPNWYGTNHSQFCRKSTHGACPVIEGKKCVIQQWIARTTPLPLREPRVAAIFTAGADYSFFERNHTIWFDDSNLQEKQTCLADVSTNRGKFLSKLCLTDPNAKFQWLDASEGPYKGTGGLRLIGGGLSGSIPLALLKDNGLTVSFWVRNIQAGKTLLELTDLLSVVVVDASEDASKFVQTQIRLLRPGYDDSSSQANNNVAAGLTVSNPNSLKDWLWFSLQVDTALSAILNILSRTGELLGSATLPSDSHDCTSLDTDSQVKLQMFVPDSSKTTNQGTAFVADISTSTAFVSMSGANADVSFILIHKAVVDNAENLRGEIGRYNIAL